MTVRSLRAGIANLLRGVASVAGVALLAAAGAPLHAQERWAVVSAIGDRMSIVSPRMQTGSNLRNNDSRDIAMNDAVLDRLALRAVTGAKVAGAPEMLPVALKDPKLYELQEGLFADAGKPLLDSLRKALAAANVTHIVLLTRLRGDAAFPLKEGPTGQGTVEGLGFYLDRHTKLKVEKSGDRDEGFLGSFAYYRLVLFDLTGGKVVGTEDARAAETFLLAGTDKTHPWDVLTAEQKIDELDRLLKRSAGQAVAALVAKRAGR